MGNKNRGKRYDEEFKSGAVRLVREKGRSPADVATDLGVTTETIRNWVKEHDLSQNGEIARLRELEVENRKLKKEVDDLKDTVEILKKATAIFANPQKKYTK